MKKYIYVAFLIISVASIISCGKGNSENGEQNQQDSVITTNEANKEESAEESAMPDPFETCDLAFYDLRGHVKEMTQDGNTHEFSYDGDLLNEVNGETESDEFDPFTLERDESGRIAGTSNGHSVYFYNKENRISGEQYGHQGYGSEVEYKYDDKGLRISEINWECVCGDEGYEKDESTKKVIEYQDITYDSHMNWTSRTRDGNKETREITYY